GRQAGACATAKVGGQGTIRSRAEGGQCRRPRGGLFAVGAGTGGGAREARRFMAGAAGGVTSRGRASGGAGAQPAAAAQGGDSPGSVAQRQSELAARRR